MHIATTHMFILVYVEDMIITSSSSAMVDALISSLSQAFQVKDLGLLFYFLGVELDYLPIGVFSINV